MGGFQRDERFWSDRVVLVTGGCGFIGSHLVDALLDAGAVVRVLGRYSSTSSLGFLEERSGHPRLHVTLGTVSDATLVRRVTQGVDTVFHLAALIGIPYSYIAPDHYVDTNVTGTLRVLDAATELGVRRVVHTSTSETFGSAQYVPMDERHPIVAQSPYAATKVAADQLAGSYHRSFGTPVVTLRPFNTFGPRQSQRAVIPTIVAQLLAGPRVELGSTTPVRDMNPVPNTVDAFLRAAEAPDVEGDLFVVGSGEGRSVGDIVAAIGAQLGVAPEIVADADRVRPEGSEVDRLVCDWSHARDRLGYTPTYPFERCLADTVAHLRTTRLRTGYVV